jgi:hypothetical protein
MASNPKLKQVNRSSPFRPLIDDLNRAIGDQSQSRPGTGFGQIGNRIRFVSQDWMVAFTDANGIPAATLKVDGDPSKGRDLGQGVAFEHTVEINDDGSVSIVPAGPEDVTQIKCFNYSHFSAVPPNTLVELQKRFGLWMVTWEECGGQ